MGCSEILVITRLHGARGKAVPVLNDVMKPIKLRLLVTGNVVSSSPIFVILMMETILRNAGSYKSHMA
jgi:hypothetical protein